MARLRCAAAFFLLIACLAGLSAGYPKIARERREKSVRNRCSALVDDPSDALTGMRRASRRGLRSSSGTPRRPVMETERGPVHTTLALSPHSQRSSYRPPLPRSCLKSRATINVPLASSSCSCSTSHSSHTLAHDEQERERKRKK